MSAISVGWLYVGWGAVTFETNYGLMQQSPLEIKEKLLKALDKEYNVVDMVAVLDIVSVLEKTSITKEALETTRLGKYINELRRKTNDDALAKRAKDLVRRWRDMILPQAEPAPVPLNGASDAVPRTHQANKRPRKHAESPPPAAPPLKQPRLNGSALRPNAGECSRESSEPDDPPKRKGRKKGSKNRSTLGKEISQSKSSDDIVKEKIASIARTPRVKTTQELLAGLKSKTDGALPEPRPVEREDELTRNKSEHIEKFLRSQVEVEEDSRPSTETASRSAASSPGPPPEETSVADILSRLPPLDPDAIDWEEESAPASPPPAPPVTPHHLLRLHSEHVECLNGCADHSGLNDGFSEWHQVVSRTSYNGELLHVLPYVVID